MYEPKQRPIAEQILSDEWFLSIPDDRYQPCHCGGIDGKGCQRKIHFVIKDGDEEIDKHIDNFITNKQKGLI